MPTVYIFVNLLELREIVFYRKANGSCEVENYLDSLPAKDAQKILWVLKIIEEMDIVPKQYFKKLVGTEIWEARIQFGSNIYRILGFFTSGRNLVFTHGFTKKHQKTPLGEIEKAEIIRIKVLKE